MDIEVLGIVRVVINNSTSTNNAANKLNNTADNTDTTDNKPNNTADNTIIVLINLNILLIT